MESLLDSVEAAVSGCSRHWNTSALDTADQIVMHLERCDRDLSTFIEEQRQSGFDQCNFRDLHRCISQLLIQWNCKVLRLETTVGHIQEGRPRKSVNIELVFNKIKIIIANFYVGQRWEGYNC